MPTSNRSAVILRLSLASALAACPLWPGIPAPVNHSKASALANPLPNPRATEAVEHIKFAIKATGLGGGMGAMVSAARIASGGFVAVSAASFTTPVAPKEVVAGFGSGPSDTTV